MNKIRFVAAVLLAIPLLVFGGSYYIHLFPFPPANGQPGIVLLHLMREGGLTYPITFSQVPAGVFLLLPRPRFLAALLQLPMTTGIVAFR